MTIRTLACYALALTLAAAAPLSVAKTKKKQASGESAQERIHRGSAESTAEREKRLLRECKGRPNAGACAGFTG
jgi:hypothetical protein